MKNLLIGLAVISIGISLLQELPTLAPLKPQHQREELLPAFLAPLTFADVQQGIKERANDRCIASAFEADLPPWQQAQYPVRRDGSTGRRAEVTAFLVCHIEQMRAFPLQLCLGPAKDRLARYVRGYFLLLAELKDAPAPPQAFVSLQRQLDTGSDIQIGHEDFSPDRRIIDGLKGLISDGAFTESDNLAEKLSPEVPSDVIEELTATKPGKALCP